MVESCESHCIITLEGHKRKVEVLLIKATVCYSCVANGSWKLLKGQAVKLHVTRERHATAAF